MSKKHKKSKVRSVKQSGGHKKAKVIPIKQSDGLINLITGMGGPNTKTAGNQWAYGILNNFQEVEACYEENWIARRIVDVVADDITSTWRTIKSDDAEAIHRLENVMSLSSAVNESIRWARLYGGAGLLMLTGQPLDKPLDVSKIKKGDLKRLIVFDRWAMSSMSFNTHNILEANFLRPESYIIQNGGQVIHYTHFALFYGEPLPTRLLTQTQGWGDSVLRKCLKPITDLQSAVQGVAELMQEANVDIFKVEGLADALAGSQENQVMKRLELLREGKSNFKAVYIDASEEYSRNPLNLTGVDSSLNLLMTMVSGSDAIPMTRLFGTSAKGMDATGEGDRRDYYDNIDSKRTGAIALAMRTIDEVLVRSAIGSFPDEFDYEWNPLEENDTLNTAQTQLTESQKHIALLDANLVSPSQVMSVLQSTEQYQYPEGQIEELSETEEPNMFNQDPESGAVEPETPFDI